MTERILTHYRIQLTRESTGKEPFVHVQLTCDDSTIFACDAYNADMLHTTLRMLCGWVSDNVGTV
jgi:hypothetical protein